VSADGSVGARADGVAVARLARRLAIGVTTALVLLVGACAGLDELAQRREAALGGRAFDGLDPLTARIEGHGSALPADAAACANCHRPQPRPVGASGSPIESASFGPPLDREGLTGRTARRGGPPSRFDERSFCRLLRTGEDPAGVILPRAMPRYEIDDADCRRLWRHLTRPSAGPALAATTR
jgi:hypothetical protein